MKNIQYNQQIKENKLANELKNINDSNEQIIAENSAMYDYMQSKEFLNPIDLLPKAYLTNMKEKHRQELLKQWKETTEMNKELKEQYDKDYEKYSEEMTEVIKYNIEEQGRLLAINQQNNQLLKSREANYNHLVEIQTNTINKTSDLDMENSMLKYKYDTVNKQPEVYQNTEKLQQKLAKAKTKNDTLKTNIGLQNQIKQVNMENAVLDGNDITLNDTNGTFTSAFTDQIAKTEKLKANLEDVKEKRQAIKQRKAEEKRHKEAMASKQARIKAYQPFDNNNNNNDNTETIATLQATHEIEEKAKDEEVEKQRLIREMNDIHKRRDPNGRAWLNWLERPYPYWCVDEMTINDMDNDQLKEYIATYNEEIDKMEHEHPEKLHIKPHFANQEHFEEEEEE